MNGGTADLFFERITKWVSDMRGAGSVVEYCIEEDAVHDTFMVGDLTGFEDSAWNVAQQMAEFVKSL